MEELLNKLITLSEHLILLDKTFQKQSNFSEKIDFLIYKENIDRFKDLAVKEQLKTTTIRINEQDKGERITQSLIDEIYSPSGRQMKLADIIEYLFFSRGIFYLFQGDKYDTKRIPKLLEICLRFVNVLMIYETLTVDYKLRQVFLKNLKPLVRNERGYKDLIAWPTYVGLSRTDDNFKKDAPNEYFDTLLPKTAGGLWHEILVYCFILKYNIGYIFPLLLIQKPISLTRKLSPPDLIILHSKTFSYYGIEIGSLKERQSGGFMAPSGMPVIPIDTKNARISDRCPTCSKWIGICPKVINDFTDISRYDEKPTNEIRCLTDCEIYTLDQKLNAKCPYMKFRYKNDNWNFAFADGNHHHYRCCINKNTAIINNITSMKSYSQLQRLNELLQQTSRTVEEDQELKDLQLKLRKKYSFIKTHSVYYTELLYLHKMSSAQDKMSDETDTAEIDEQESE